MKPPDCGHALARGGPHASRTRRTAHLPRTTRALALGTVLFASTALAFVLPAPSILRRLVETRDALQLFTLRVDGALSLFGTAARDAAPVLGVAADRAELQSDAAVLMKLPGRCRAQTTPLEGKPSVAVNASGKKRQEGGAIPAVDVMLDQVCAILAVRSSSDAEAKALIERHLGTLGINVGAPTSLARFGGEVAYVIGAAAPDAPQFWVYKDSFLPARVRFKGADGVSWDVRFLDYTSPVTGEWFPRTIEVGRDQELALRFTALKSDVRSKLDDKLF